jgi:hypothetical protein
MIRVWRGSWTSGEPDQLSPTWRPCPFHKGWGFSETTFHKWLPEQRPSGSTPGGLCVSGHSPRLGKPFRIISGKATEYSVAPYATRACVARQSVPMRRSPTSHPVNSVTDPTQKPRASPCFLLVAERSSSAWRIAMSQHVGLPALRALPRREMRTATLPEGSG